MFVASRKQVGKQLVEIKAQLEKFSSGNAKIMELLENKAGDQNGSDMLRLFKFMVEENRKNSAILTSLTNAVSQLTTETERPEEAAGQAPRLDELPISGLDARILEYIQVKGMACADDVRQAMKYRARNAACARLSVLHKRGILQRYQLGHKVYYKYDAGKATNTLIVSPPH